MSKKRPIPSVPANAAAHGRLPFDQAVKETLEQLTGQRGTPIAPLPSTASTTEIIAKINEIISVLQ